MTVMRAPGLMGSVSFRAASSPPATTRTSALSRSTNSGKYLMRRLRSGWVRGHRAPSANDLAAEARGRLRVRDPVEPGGFVGAHGIEALRPLRRDVDVAGGAAQAPPPTAVERKTGARITRPHPPRP